MESKIGIGVPIVVILHGTPEKGESIKYLSDKEIRIKLEKDSLPDSPNYIDVDLEKYPVRVDKDGFVISILKDL